MVKCIIIGAGIAGLVAGSYLIRAKHEVIIFEQYPQIGGVTATLHLDGYSWDLGPMLLENFGPGEPAGDILDELDLRKYLKLQRDDRGNVFPDFSLWKPTEYQGPYWRRERLKDLFPAEAGGVNRYYRFYDRVMDLMTLNQRISKSHGLQRIFLKIWMMTLYLSLKGYFTWNAARLMSFFFHDVKIKTVFTGLLADFVTVPEQFPALGIPILNNEIPFDVRIPLRTTCAGPRASYHYCLGGMEKLVAVFSHDIQERGGKIYPNSEVVKIVIENGVCKGVKLANGEIHGADHILISGGVHEAYFSLIGKSHLSNDWERKIHDIPLMESVHMVHLGIDYNPLPFQPAALCYYYGTYDVHDAIRRCQNGIYHEGKDGFLIYFPSVHSPAMAPPGHYAMTIYTIAPNRLKEGMWAAQKEEFTEKLLIEAERYFPGLRNHIKVKIIITPEDFQQRTHMHHHAFGGRAPVMGKSGGPHRTPIKNVWFIGCQSDKKGSGVWGTMVHSHEVVQELLREL